MSHPSLHRLRLRHVQSGAASVAIAFLMLLLVGGALIAALNMTGAVVLDAALSTQQTQALHLAESGMARALKRYGQGTLCADLGPDGPHALGAGSFTVTSGVTTGFNGLALPVLQCRVRVIGSVGGAVRTIEAIMERSTNGFPPEANPDFNAPPGACVYPGCMPTNWSFSSDGWDDTGGPALPLPANSRAAYIWKTPGGGVSTTAGGYNFSPSITRTGPKVLNVSFDYRNIVQGGASKIKVFFTLHEKAPGTRSWTSTTFQEGATPGWVRSGTTTTSTSPAYVYTAPASPTITLPSGTIYIDRISFTLSSDSGNSYQAWLDNISIDGEETGLTTEERAVIKVWREVMQ